MSQTSLGQYVYWYVKYALGFWGFSHRETAHSSTHSPWHSQTSVMFHNDFDASSNTDEHFECYVYVYVTLEPSLCYRTQRLKLSFIVRQVPNTVRSPWGGAFVFCNDNVLSCSEYTLWPLCWWSSSPPAQLVFTEINPGQEELLAALSASHSGSPWFP